MISKAPITLVFWIAALWWAALLIWQTGTLPDKFFQPMSAVSGSIILLITAFEKYLWKLSILHPWLVPIPNIEGTWRGELISSWTDPETKQQIPPILTYATIQQTYSSICVELFTTELESVSLAGSLVKEEGGSFVVMAVYRGTPHLKHRDVSPIHFGGFRLKIQGTPPKALVGHYWSDRKTRGEMTFDACSKTITHDFKSASALFKPQVEKA